MSALTLAWEQYQGMRNVEACMMMIMCQLVFLFIALNTNVEYHLNKLYMNAFPGLLSQVCIFHNQREK